MQARELQTKACEKLVEFIYQLPQQGVRSR
jgi:hypothetical protein